MLNRPLATNNYVDADVFACHRHTTAHFVRSPLISIFRALRSDPRRWGEQLRDLDVRDSVPHSQTKDNFFARRNSRELTQQVQKGTRLEEKTSVDTNEGILYAPSDSEGKESHQRFLLRISNSNAYDDHDNIQHNQERGHPVRHTEFLIPALHIYLNTRGQSQVERRGYGLLYRHVLDSRASQP